MRRADQTRLEMIQRPRRLRMNPILRSMVEETRLSPKDFIYPMFIEEGRKGRKDRFEIPSMPGVFRQSIDAALKEMEQCISLGVRSVILFGIPLHKDPLGSQAHAENAIVQRAVRAAKKTFGRELFVVTDVCLCEYTDHGHCAPVEGEEILNDEGVSIHCKTALSHAVAGADMVAPSDMMDGRVGAIRDTLDEAGYTNLPIMAYAAKYASGFYGPFREAADSTPQFGDRRSYQMDPANSDEALREVELDVEEGADIVMVKPALPYLDIIRRVRETFALPVAAYNVSGEYAMVKAAARLGWIDHDRVMMETLTGIKRAGASIILTYFAKDAAAILNKQGI